MLKMILFDLDGTLLPMDQEVFTKDYFKRLAAKLLPHGYQADQLVDGIWAGTAAVSYTHLDVYKRQLLSLLIMVDS